MKKICKQVLSCLCVAALFLGGFHWLEGLFMNKQSYTKYEQFRETDKEFDILFIGSSHVINGVSPLDLFHNYGITSFNFSMHGNYAGSGYYLLEEALETMEKQGKPLPKAVVLDVFSWGEGIANLHNAWDSFPVWGNKREFAATLDKELRESLLFPFSIYHSRWTELKKNDFETAKNTRYGVELRYGVKLPAAEIITNPEDTAEVKAEKLECLDRYQALCEEKGMKLYLIHIPYSYSPNWQREANGLYAYAKDRGIPYVNYMNEETGIDFDIDFYDEGHLNPVGMRTMTALLGGYLTAEGFSDHRGEAIGETWEKEYRDYIGYRIQRLKDTKELLIYLMALNDPDLYAEVQVKESCWNDKQIGKLLERLKACGASVTTLDPGDSYGVRCTVYRAAEREKPVCQAGFVWKGKWEFAEVK